MSWAMMLVLGGYLLLWVVLLVHCVRRKEFFPVFRRANATKVFWLVTFALFNPALTLWYLVWGVFAPRKAAPSGWKTAVVVIPAVLVAIVPVVAGVVIRS